MILSRYPLMATRNLLLPPARTYDRLNMQRGAFEALTDTPTGLIRFYSVHLDHHDPDERIAQIRFLKDRVLGYHLEGGALTGASEWGFAEHPDTDDHVIMSDFNMQPETPEYVVICGMKDLFYSRLLRATAPCDVLAHFGKTGPSTFSWVDPANQTARQLLDYCFVSPSLVGRFIDGSIDMTATASDHMPLWVEMR